MVRGCYQPGVYVPLKAFFSSSEFNDILMAIINHQEFFNAYDF